MLTKSQTKAVKFYNFIEKIDLAGKLDAILALSLWTLCGLMLTAFQAFVLWAIAYASDWYVSIGVLAGIQVILGVFIALYSNYNRGRVITEGKTA